MKTCLIAVVVISIMAVLTIGPVYDSALGNETLSGTVVETMDSGGYTYALIEKNDKQAWVAVPQAKIVKGQTVTFQPGMMMTNFKSKTLNRTFDTIIFSGGVVQ